MAHAQKEVPPAVIESLSQTTVDFAPYLWRALEGPPDTYARQLWGGECFYHQYSKVTANTSDCTGLYIVSFAEEQEFSLPVLKTRVTNAWLGARYHAPLIGAKILEDVGIAGTPPHLGCFVYEAHKTKEELLAWADSHVSFHTPEPGERFHDAADRIRRRLTSRACSSDSRCTAHVLVSDQKNDRGRYNLCLCINGTHSVLDAAGSNRLVARWMQYLNDPTFDPFLLDWGKGDVENLPVTGIEAVGMDPEVQDPQVMMSALEPYAVEYGPSLALEPQRPFRGPLAEGTRHTIRFVEPKVIRALRTAVKSCNPDFRLSHAIDAARHVAVWFLRTREAQRSGVPIGEQYMVNPLLPVDIYPSLEGKWKGSLYVCSATLGFTTAVSLSTLDQAAQGIAGAAEIQQAAFDALLPHLSKEWDKGRQLDRKAAMMIMQTILDLLNVRCEAPVHLMPQRPTDAFTSLGVVDKIPLGGFIGAWQDGALSQETSECKSAYTLGFACPYPRLAFTATCMHTWCFADTVSISLAYTEEYDEAYIEEFLDIIVAILERAAECR